MLTKTEYHIIYDAVTPQPFNILALTVGDFLSMLARPEGVVEYADKHADTDIERVRVAKGITQAVEGLFKVIKSWQPSPTKEQQQASRGVAWPTFAESVLLECVETYHLTSTAQAEHLPLADWYIAHKHNSATAKYNANYNAIISHHDKSQH